MKEPGLFGDTLPEGVAAELTVGELEEMACRQQQQIESQRQLLAAKEQRLRFLKQHEAKHQLVATEHERLRRLREKVESQEQKLRKLRALRGQVDQTKHDNVSLTSDLESIRALFNEKEKELSIAVAKVEELTRQLEQLRRGRDSNSNQVPSSVAAVELEKLRSELLYRNKLNEQHSARLSHQKELLAQRREEMTAIDGRIGELQERLHRKRTLNQQLAHHVDNGQRQNRDDNQKLVAQRVYQPSLSQNQSLQKCFQYHQQQQLLQKHGQKLREMRQMQLQKQNQQHQHQQMQMRTSPSGFNNLSAMGKSVPPKAAGNAVAVSQGMCAATKHLAKISGNGANIVAVEPYHHVPSIKSNQQQQQQLAGACSATASDHNKRGSLKNDQADATPPSGQRIVIYPSHPFAGQRDAKTQPAQEDDRLAAGTPTEAKSAEGGPGGSRAAEFWSSRFDSKYQTPSTAAVGRYGAISHYECRRPAEGVESAPAAAGVLESNLKFGSIDKRLSSDGYADNNRVDESGSESVVSNEPSQPSDGSRVGADTAAKNLATVGTAGTCQQQSPAHIHPMNIVRSMPIQTSTNKGLATPLSNASYAARCTAGSINNFSRSYEASPFGGYNNHSSDKHSVAAVVACSSTVVTYTSTYQKPVSSVSPIYQTSSTRIQPVQPQIIGSFSTAYNQQIREARNSFPRNDNAVESHASKPALPPKPAPPVKATATPPPPPRQSAFHSQLVGQTEDKSCDQQSAFCDPLADANCNVELESRLAGLDLQGQADADDEYYSMAVTAQPDANANVIVGTFVNTNARNGLTFPADVSPRKCDSPPPLPNVEPPSDDDDDDEDVDRPTKLRTASVQNAAAERNNNNNNKDGSVVQVTANDRLVSDRSHDSSCSDTSGAESNYLFVSSNRRIELPPAYLFPESGAPPRHLVAADARQHVDVISSLKSVDQPNADASEDDKTSPCSLSPNSDDSAPLINAYNETKEDTKKLKKGNLKNTNNANSKRRVSFDPLALLLDASLEGELELVVRTAGQVKNPSAANDEGITALHNAICAGHFEIVKFLTQFGCDVNAQDSDGWTPLHCAASCNNLPMVRFLVEHGACIFATTLSDQETAAEKCEEDEEGFDGCSEFLYSVQEKLGILNNGAVYAVFDYEAHNTDELSFKEGDRLTVLRKGDEWEREWWWSRLLDKEGYIPRNLLGLYPRIPGNVNQLQH